MNAMVTCQGGRMSAVKETTTSRNEMLLEHYDLARAIAFKVHQRLPSTVDLDDLISAAVTGLIEAIDRYEAERAIPFVAYAKYRIHGAVVDTLRAADWVPRSVRKKAHQIEEVRTHLNDKLKRHPTRDEMAHAMELTPEKYDQMFDDSKLRKLLSLDAPIDSDNSTPLIEAIPADGDLTTDWQKRQLQTAVLKEIESLPDREKTAIVLYYLRELSLKEVGTVLGVSESRACQLCTQATKRLRFRLRNHVN